MLLPRHLQLKSRFGWSLSNLEVLLRMNLFTYRDAFPIRLMCRCLSVSASVTTTGESDR